MTKEWWTLIWWYCSFWGEVVIDPVYSAKKAGLGRGSARPFCHCKRTKRPNARPKTAAAETISRGSLGRGSARPFLTVNASRPKCGTKWDPRIRKYVWSSWHHRIWRHYPAFFFDRCSYFVFFSSVEITKFVRVNYWQKLKIITFLFELSFHQFVLCCFIRIFVDQLQ